jgi:L,D-transpeptidase YcbB
MFKNRIFIFSAIFIILCFSSCKRSEKSLEPIIYAPAELVEKGLSEGEKFQISMKIHAFISSDSLINEAWNGLPIFLSEPDLLQSIYQLSDFHALWLDAKNLEDAFFVIEESAWDGFWPADYHLEAIRLLSTDLDREHTDVKRFALRDILLSDAIITLARHLAEGKTDPLHFEKSWNYPSCSLSDDKALSLMPALEQGKLREWIRGQRPEWPTYARMRQSLMQYYQMKENGGWDALPEPEFRKLEPGDTHAWVSLLRKRLAREGDYEYPDEDFIAEDSVYDDALVFAVQRFQKRHNLHMDGVIGKNTIEHLNMSVEDKIECIRANLERLRWLRDPLHGHNLIVNIPAFELYLYSGVEEAFQTKVMVGTARTRTPVFQSTLHYLEFNPDWTVPVSIMRGDILSKLKSNPNYLTDNNMQLLDSRGGVWNMDGRAPEDFIAGRYPVTVRQKPGAGNALGNVKFIFANSHSVFLHDTPSRYFFERESRAFSHGCVRVQHPLKLAEYLLADPERWNEAQIRSQVQTSRTHRVMMKDTIKVNLVYHTHTSLPDGTAMFYKDIYRKDKPLIDALQPTLSKPEALLVSGNLSSAKPNL